MSLASQVSALATAIGAKIKVATPITKRKVEPFGTNPASSSAAQGILTGIGFFTTSTYGTDGATLVPSTSTWYIDGHWSGTYTLTIQYNKGSNSGICKHEISKDGGSTWTTLASGIDSYNATTIAMTATYTGIAISEGADVRFRVTVTGKNASSSAYFYVISGYEMIRTGA